MPNHDVWYDVELDGARVGDMTNGTWSFRFERNIGFGLLSVDCNVGDRVEVVKPTGRVGATVTDLPFRLA